MTSKRTKRPIPNLVLRRIREEERRETREEFAKALIRAGEPGLACDARHVARWEDGQVKNPRPAYQRALAEVTGRPFDQLGFAPRRPAAGPAPEPLATEPSSTGHPVTGPPATEVGTQRPVTEHHAARHAAIESPAIENSGTEGAGTERVATGRPAAGRPAMEMPTSNEVAYNRITFHVDEDGQVWATVDRRTFLVGSSAALLLQAGVDPAAGSVGPTGPVPAAGSMPGAGAAPDAAALPAAGSTPIIGDMADRHGFAAFVREHWPDLRLSRPVPDLGVDYTALLPDGRTVSGASLRLQLHSATARGGSGRAVVTVADRARWSDFSRGLARGLVVAAAGTPERPEFYVLDVREARGRLAARGGGGPLTVPAAYRLDDFTYGLLWAATNLDAGLQADDQELAATRVDLAGYARLRASAVSHDAAADLGTIARMWIGSEFCARHILRNLGTLPDVPTFWTREQRGEEACTWLLFDHKYPYLRSSTRACTTGEQLTRMFCVPRAAVADSPRHERILLFLAVALMEATGIHVKVSDDPAFSGVEGFVLGGGDQAIIANWVRGAGMWHVDTTRRGSVLRAFHEASGHVDAHSVIEAADPAGRLRGLAHYLELDWPWLRGRCADLAAAGSGGLLRPRSRLLSVAGVDAACGYVARLASLAA